MKVSLCTISFRHHLLSIREIADFAQGCGFAGIELWGVHARNLGPGHHAEWLVGYGLRVPMLSDYLPLFTRNHDRTHGPLYRIALNDVVGTELYVSSRTGEIVREKYGAPDCVPHAIRTGNLQLRKVALILRAHYGPKLSQACGSDSANATSGSPPAGFLALSPPKLRWQLSYPRRGQNNTLLCNGIGKEGRN